MLKALMEKQTTCKSRGNVKRREQRVLRKNLKETLKTKNIFNRNED